MKNIFQTKTLYLYILKTFIPIFVMTFAICTFLVIMQFLWKEIDEIVGKGLPLKIIVEMFFYASLSLIPIALPLSILLASLMTFGNMGEQLELLAIKSAGISLLKSMRPVIVFIALIAIGAFFFLNNLLPIIQTRSNSLLYSIKQKSPALDIPERSFYKKVQGYNIYVERKDKKTGMMYDVLIYDIANGFNNMAVILCDSAELKTADNKLSLLFILHSGQQFQNFKQGNSTYNNSEKFVSYSRENFRSKKIIIQYDDNFNRMDESVIAESNSWNYLSKNLSQLYHSIDSMKVEMDSINLVDRKIIKEYSYLRFRNSYQTENKDSVILAASKAPIINSDSVFKNKTTNEKSSILQSAYSKAENNSSEFQFKSFSKLDTKKTINRYWTEFDKKFTISFACLLFFFIGAPLGSIVRKGGLGMPVVICLILFIIYYILDNSIGYKMARDGIWFHWVGMWFSAAILTPLAIFLTYKAMSDSVLLNSDTYRNFIRRVFFIPEKRSYTRKEVIVEDPHYQAIDNSLDLLSEKIKSYLSKYKRLGYKTYWTDKTYGEKMYEIVKILERNLGHISNSRDARVLDLAENYPILIRHFRPGGIGSLTAKIFMFLFPIGIIFKLISFPYERRIARDMNTILSLNKDFKKLINNL